MKIFAWLKSKHYNIETLSLVDATYFPDAMMQTGVYRKYVREDSFCAFYYAPYPPKTEPNFKLYYAGEPQTNKCWNEWDMNNTLTRFGNRLLVDEAGTVLLERYLNEKCQVSFSSYRHVIRWFEKLTRWRIPIPFSTPIKNWEWIEENFGEIQHGGSLASTDFTIRKSRFNHVWFNPNKFYFSWQMRAMVKWAVAHNKTI